MCLSFGLNQSVNGMLSLKNKKPTEYSLPVVAMRHIILSLGNTVLLVSYTLLHAMTSVACRRTLYYHSLFTGKLSLIVFLGIAFVSTKQIHTYIPLFLILCCSISPCLIFLSFISFSSSSKVGISATHLKKKKEEGW